MTAELSGELLERFEGGEPLSRGDTTIRWEGEEWYFLDQLSPSQTASDGVVSFRGNMAPWIVNDFKRYVADLWYSGGKVGMMRGGRTAIVALCKALPDFTGCSIELTREHARRVERYFLGERYDGGAGCIVREPRYAPKTLDTMQTHINAFMGFVRRIHPGARNSFVLNIPIEYRRSNSHVLSQDPEKFLDPEVLREIIAACRQEEEAYEAALEQVRKTGKPNAGKGVSLDMLRGRAVKAQAVKLLVCVGRRVTAVCEAPMDLRMDDYQKGRPKREDVPDADEAWGTWVYFQEQKIQNALEPVFCPFELGLIARDAVEKSKRYGEAFRTEAPRYSGFLFPTKSPQGVTLLNRCTLRLYLKHRDSGLIQRYAIKKGGDAAELLTSINTHDFRTTRATLLWINGMDLVEVAHDLGHVLGFEGGVPHPEMTGNYYIAGVWQVQAQAVSALRQGAYSARGDVIEMTQARIVMGERLRATRMLPVLHEAGEVLQLTRYGGCRWASRNGPCPTANECWEGIDPDRPDTLEGHGCEYQVIMPHAIPALEERERFLVAQIVFYESLPGYEHWLAEERRKLGKLRRQLQRAYELRDDLELSAGAADVA